MSNFLFTGLRVWHWIILGAVVFFWTDTASDWGDEARHFGYKLWPLLVVLILVFSSPIVAVVSGILTVKGYRENKIAKPVAFWRLTWALVILGNFAILAWITKGFR